MISINTDLRRKILEHNEDIKKCYQCSTCSASCPVLKYDPDFNPRVLIIKALFGSEDTLKSKEFWKCLSCDRCNERCPQGVNPFNVLLKLKNFLFSQNLAPKERIDARELIITTGFSYPVSSAVDRKRESIKLEALESIGEELKKIIGTEESE
ncbi:MAG: 4Fe-4S dicluster domain-containing protein [Thermodesulfobacteriota bacterium]